MSPFFCGCLSDRAQTHAAVFHASGVGAAKIDESQTVPATKLQSHQFGQVVARSIERCSGHKMDLMPPAKIIPMS
jgi:hypothetical protein